MTPSTSSKSTTKTGKISTYNPAFQQNLIDHGIYPNGYQYLDDRVSVRPDNWVEIQEMIIQPRLSLSSSQFSDGAFIEFIRETDRALTEKTVLRKPLSTLVGNADIPSQDDLPFGNLAPLTDGTIANAKPDYYEGARPEQLDRRIRNQLGPYVVPSTNHSAPIVPTFFTQGKGPNGSRAVAKRQSCYEGAMGARAIQRLQSYERPEPVYDNNAYTITSTFDGEHLHMYATHSTQPTNPEDPPEYHMNQLRSFAMTDTAESFRQGATAYRNGRDWAKKKRDEFIEAANGRVTSLPQNMSFESSDYSEPSTSTNRAAALESDTSANKFTLDHETITRRSSKRPKGGQPERNDREYRSADATDLSGEGDSQNIDRQR